VTKLALTGFGAFPGVADNPTQRLIEHFRQSPSQLPQDTALHLLDVDYRSVGAQIDALLHEPPRALLLTGYSNLATSITLEARAHGICAPDKPDATGQFPAPFPAERPDLFTRTDVEALCLALAEEDLPVAISHDAGQYLCNYSYRHALERVEERGLSTQVLFVHTPALSDTPLAADAAACLPLETMARALARIARELAA
jgi:pyroglutamyl-peptidase